MVPPHNYLVLLLLLNILHPISYILQVTLSVTLQQEGEGDQGQLGEGDQEQHGEGDQGQHGEGDQGQYGERDQVEHGEGDQGQTGEGDHVQHGEGDQQEKISNIHTKVTGGTKLRQPPLHDEEEQWDGQQYDEDQWNSLLDNNENEQCYKFGTVRCPLSELGPGQIEGNCGEYLNFDKTSLANQNAVLKPGDQVKFQVFDSEKFADNVQVLDLLMK